eukprot:COSAG02_NODE_35231_length_471_cov_1.943548_1_plen_142_part_10
MAVSAVKSGNRHKRRHRAPLVNEDYTNKKRSRNDWKFPGGKIEPDETPLAAGLRELEEETGITIASDHPHKTVSYKEHSRATVDTHAFVFQLDQNPTAIPDSDRNPLGGEVKQCKWMPYLELTDLKQVLPSLSPAGFGIFPP